MAIPRQWIVLSKPYIFGTKDQTDRLALANLLLFASQRKQGGTDLYATVSDDAQKQVGTSQKARHIFSGRLIVNFLWGSNLLNVAIVDHGNAISQFQRFFLVMSDEYRGHLYLS